MDEFSPGAGRSEALREVALMFAELGEELDSLASKAPFDAVTQVALRRIDGAEAASLTTYVDDHFNTAASTDRRARDADRIQYDLGSGPCVDAILEHTVHCPKDLRQDPRWPEFGKRVNEQFGFASMVSYRLGLGQAAEDVIAGLNVYSTHVEAFDEEAIEVGSLLATHAAAVVTAETSRNKARNLERALRSNRDIGVAIGVLMTQHKITHDQAFDLLRVTSQRLNRKISDLALDVADTGALPTWSLPSR